MIEVGAFEAKTKLSALLAQVEKGEEVLITNRGRPVARLVPVIQGFDREAARQAAERIRARAKTIKGTFDWEEWKTWLNEGRP